MRKAPVSRTLLVGFGMSLSAAVLAAQMMPRATPKELGLSQERLDGIKAQEEKYVAQNQLAGGVMLIARRGKVASFETFGMMDKESGKPMQADTIFGQHSMTK